MLVLSTILVYQYYDRQEQEIPLVKEQCSCRLWFTLLCNLRVVSWKLTWMKCPEKYIKAYIFFIIQWIEFKFENFKYSSIYLKNIKKFIIFFFFFGGNNLTCKFHDNFQVKLFLPNFFFFIFFLLFF
jgi:hypothetical protein